MASYSSHHVPSRPGILAAGRCVRRNWRSRRATRRSLGIGPGPVGGRAQVARLLPRGGRPVDGAVGRGKIAARRSARRPPRECRRPAWGPALAANPVSPWRRSRRYPTCHAPRDESRPPPGGARVATARGRAPERGPGVAAAGGRGHRASRPGGRPGKATGVRGQDASALSFMGPSGICPLASDCQECLRHGGGVRSARSITGCAAEGVTAGS